MASAADMRVELRAAVARAGSQRAFAARNGLSNSTVSLVLSEKREADEVVANALGYIKEPASYTKARNKQYAG